MDAVMARLALAGMNIGGMILVGRRDHMLVDVRRYRGNPMLPMQLDDARIGDPGAQGKQPYQQHMHCESAKALGLGEHDRFVVAGRVEGMEEGYF